jgi:hypothetical protein
MQIDRSSLEGDGGDIDCTDGYLKLTSIGCVLQGFIGVNKNKNYCFYCSTCNSRKLTVIFSKMPAAWTRIAAAESRDFGWLPKNGRRPKLQ